MPKRVSARSIKLNRLYTYEEAADALGVSIQTVRGWRGQGMPVLTQKRPHIILGFALKDFIDSRSQKAKCKLADDQFLCMSCKAPRRPFGLMADYVPITEARGRLEALCETCEGRCNRLVSVNDIPRFSQILDIASRCTEDA